MPAHTLPSMPVARTIARFNKPKRADQPSAISPAEADWPSCQPQKPPRTDASPWAARSMPANCASTSISRFTA